MPLLLAWFELDWEMLHQNWGPLHKYSDILVDKKLTVNNSALRLYAVLLLLLDLRYSFPNTEALHEPESVSEWT